MRKDFFGALCFCLAIAFIPMAVFAESIQGRVEETLTDGWKFKRAADAKTDWSQPGLEEKGWESVSVPHDWAISGPFNPQEGGGSGKLPWRGFGWYRRILPLPAHDAGKRVYLDFDGVMASPSIYVNGHLAGGWDYGYMGFRVDATPYLKAGTDNLIAVKADTTHHASRWYPGAGIYRKVTLRVCAPLHVAWRSTAVTTSSAGKDAASVRVVSAVTNTLSKPLDTRIEVTLRQKKEGRVVARQEFTVAVPANASAPIDVRFSVEHPQLWDVENPNLYTAEISLRADALRDTETTVFGIRDIAYPAGDGFHLNGRRVQIKGVCLHSDLGPIGMAFDKSAMRRELAILQDMGINGLRTSHNCPAPDLLDLCDEMGIVVWDECFDKWEGTAGRKNDQNLEEYVSRNLREFAKRDRNHPCVIAWSISNEIGVSKKPGDNGMTRERCKAFRDAIRAFDTTRPVGNGNCDGSNLNVFADLDSVGFNYNASYRGVHKKFPQKAIFYTESASALSSYGYYGLPLPKDKTDYATNDFEVSSYDFCAAPWSDIPDLEFARMEEDRYCCGDFVWTGFDYLGEPFPYTRYLAMKDFPEALLARSSYFGIVDLTGVPKDRFYLYRSLWNTKSTTVHILPHWNWAGREGKSVPVFVYTSGDSAELFLNGRSLGKKTKGEKTARPANLATGAAITASSVETRNGNLPANALDGNPDTRWCAASESVPQWLQLAFPQPVTFRKVNLVFEFPAKNYAYDLLVSNDGKAWTKLCSKEKGTNTCPALSSPAKAAFLRIAVTDSQKGQWASIRDLYVYANPEDDSNPYYDVCGKYRLRWMNVPYEPGEIKAVAYKGNVKIGEDSVRTADAPASLRLLPEKMELKAGDTVYVHVEAVDAKGVLCPLAADRVSFSLTGPGKIVAVGNGNARGLDSFAQTDSHPLYFGKAVAVLRRHGKGEVTLSVSAKGLNPAKVSFSN